MIKGLGIDMVEISRMAANITSAHFLERVFTEAERAYIGSDALSAERAAGNFAVKEALSKALGCGLAGCPLDKVEVLRNEKGAPIIQAYGNVLRKFEDMRVTREWVSITHTGGVAAAVVVLEGD